MRDRDMLKNDEIRQVVGLARAWLDHPFGLMMQFLAVYLEQENYTPPKKWLPPNMG